MAQYLDTTIPSGRILLCHACNNSKCSNPKHLYWGTDYDNIIIDGREFKTHKNAWERRVEKYGYEKACAMNGKVGNTFGAGNKGKPKSEEHKQKIRESIVELNRTRDSKFNLNSGRPRSIDYSIIIKEVKENGFKVAAEKLNLSVVNLKSRYYNAVKATK